MLIVIINSVILSLKANHPRGIAILLITTCFFIRGLVLKLSYSWFFFLLVLVFLGGVIIIIIYITSLAANEKNFFLGYTRYSFYSLIFFILVFIDMDLRKKLGSRQEMVKSLYEQEFTQSLLFCFFFLLLALVRVVKLIKLEEGPLVKRL